MQQGTFKSALSRPSFRIAVAAYTLVEASVGIGAVVLSVALFQRSGSSGWATVGALMKVLPFLFLSGISGAIADRHDHRKVLQVTFAAQVVFAMVLAFTAGSSPLVIVAVVGFLGHTAWTIAYPTMASLVPRLVDSNDLAAANGLLSTVDSLAWIAGPGVGGLLVTSMGFEAASIVQAALALTGVGLATALVRRTHGSADTDPAMSPAGDERLSAAVMAALAAVVSSRAVVVPVALLLVSNLVYGAMQVLLLVAATDLLDMSEGGYGALNAGLGAGAFGALLVINRAARSRHTTAVLAAAVVLGSLPMAAIAIVHASGLVIVLLVMSGLGLVLTEVLALTAMQRHVPIEKVARVFGVLDSLTVGAVLIGTTIAAPVIAAVGIERSLVLLGGLVPLIAAFAIPLLARDRRAVAADLDALAPSIRLLAGLPLLRHASQTSIEAIASESTERHFLAGETIIDQGGAADEFFAIVSGEVDVHIRHGTGVEEFIRTMRAGQGFGELGLMHQTPRTASVRARTDVTLVRVPGESFLRAVGPGVAMGGIGPAASIRDYVMAR